MKHYPSKEEFLQKLFIKYMLANCGGTKTEAEIKEAIKMDCKCKMNMSDLLELSDFFFSLGMDTEKVDEKENTNE